MPTISEDLTAEDIAAIRAAPEGTAFETILRCKYLAMDTVSITGFRQALQGAADMVAEWELRGVTLDGGQDDDYARFVTTDKDVALAFGFTVPLEGDDDDGIRDQSDEDDS